MGSIYILYLDSICLYRLSLMTIQICQFTAGDKLMDSPDAKISITMINDHLQPKHCNYKGIS